MFLSFTLLITNNKKFDNYRLASTESEINNKSESYSIALSEANLSGISAVALISEENGNSLVKINSTDLSSNYSASVFKGLCGENGQEITKLSALSSGYSETKIKSLKNTNFNENIGIYKLNEESKVLISCGNLPK